MPSSGAGICAPFSEALIHAVQELPAGGRRLAAVVPRNRQFKPSSGPISPSGRCIPSVVLAVGVVALTLMVLVRLVESMSQREGGQSDAVLPGT